MDDKVVEHMAKQEACQSLLHKYVKQCIEEFGCEPTRDAVEWFSMIISRELAEEYAREHLHKKAIPHEKSVDQIESPQSPTSGTEDSVLQKR